MKPMLPTSTHLSAISKKKLSLFVIPAKAEIQSFGLWIPHRVRNDTLEK